MNKYEDEWGIFIIENLKTTKMDEIGPWEDIDITIHINMYHLRTPNKLKNMIYQFFLKHDQMKNLKK